ncbi:MAG: recombinase [Desulfobulbaceae bacterium]|nr:recombinase [Desulfobulbaceae bacterium]
MSEQLQKKQISPTAQLRNILEMPGMQSLIKTTLKDKAELFTASVLEVFSADSYLQKCDPAAVAKEAMKAATLNLPLSKSLGFAWVVPFGGQPQFQIGWKGYVQLAQRTGQYKFINAGPVYEGELRKVSKLTGEVDIDGDPVSEKVIGFFAYIELTNGYSKALYWPVAKVEAHAIKYNQQCKKAGKLQGVWASDFEAMGTKTLLATLIRRYGIMSTEMLGVVREDMDSEDMAKIEIAEHANGEVIGFKAEVVDDVPAGMGGTTGEAKEEATTGPGF